MTIAAPPAPSAAPRETGHTADHVLPSALSAWVAEADAAGPVHFRDPATGRRWVLAPVPERAGTEALPAIPAGGPAPSLTEAELDELDRLTDGLDFAAAQTGTHVEAIRRGLEQADRGELIPWAEVRAEMEARFPFLKNRRRVVEASPADDAGESGGAR